jgi:hypothetical protein
LTRKAEGEYNPKLRVNSFVSVISLPSEKERDMEERKNKKI